jgi:nicotinate-nucleotide pyrophosphorylase (carboxylating)
LEAVDFVRAALDEDIGPGDLTTMAVVPLELAGKAHIRAKDHLVVCGQELAELAFVEVARRYGGGVAFEAVVPDGEWATHGDVVSRIEAPYRVILIAERLALNLLMKLSGIATNVRGFVEAAGSDGPRVVDTRKTTPLLRDLEKYAVRCGGARNHRHGLYDGVMVKDNHIRAVESLTLAVERARQEAHHLVRVEVEVKTLAELNEALSTAADVILLDNMNRDQLAECVDLARRKRPEILLEASGNMTPERIAALADLDLDFVSAGGLIHQARWIDLSLKFDD